MKFTNRFEKSSFIERCAFKNFIKLYDGFKGYHIEYTPFDGFDQYDVLLSKIEDGIITKRIFIEIKVRDKHYEEYFLETKKLNALRKTMKENYIENYTFLYLNFTPTGTYIWNTSITDDLKVSKCVMNKATMNSRSEKVNKSKYDLPISMAKHWHYTWDEGQLRPYYDEYFSSKVSSTIMKDHRFKDILLGI